MDFGNKIVRFEFLGDFYENLERAGKIPLPHYIRNGESGDEDTERYQTVYAAKPGAVAAPTAGLHFTEELLQKLIEEGGRGVIIVPQEHLSDFEPRTLKQLDGLQIPLIVPIPMGEKETTSPEAYVAQTVRRAIGYNIKI